MKTFWKLYWLALFVYSFFIFRGIYRDFRQSEISRLDRHRDHAHKLQEILDGTRQYLPTETIERMERLIARWQ